MKHYLFVLKLLIKNNYLPTRQKGEKRDAQKLAMLATFGIVYIIFAPIIVGFVFFVAPVVYAFGIVAEVTAVLLGISAVVVLLLGIVSILSYLYFSKDTEFFLQLPIKPSTIFFAKFTVIYVRETIISTAILVPTLLTLGIVTGAPWLFYLLLPFGILLAPALPLMLGALISIPLMYVVSFFKNKGAWTSVIILILGGGAFALYFIVIQMISGGDIFDGDNIEQGILAFQGAFIALANILYPYLAFSRSAFMIDNFGIGVGLSTLLNFLIFFLSVAMLFVLTMLVTNLVYKRSAASQLEGKKQQAKGNEKFTANSVRTALIKKEWKEIIRQPAFAFQVLSPIIITPILIFVMGFVGSVGFGGSVENGYGNGYGSTTPYYNGNGLLDRLGDYMPQFAWLGLFMMLIMFAITVNTGAMTAITREGKSFSISKLMPVPYKTQIQAKVFINMTISFVASLLGLIVITVLQFDIINLAFGIVLCMFLGYSFTCYATYNDLRKPKLDWATPNQAMKQNFNTVLPMLVGWGIGLVLILIAMGSILLAVFTPLALQVAQIIAWTLMIAIAVTLSILMHKLLYKNTDRLYERLGES
ncbi:MAG: hypothetical protein FWE13_02480 [Firmicutes bacterium]|nr:hypothetical protein [Bacillota bacterium]